VVFFEANTLGADDITQFFVRHKVDTAGGGAVINLQQVSDMLMAKVVRPEWLKSVTDPSCTTTRTQADVNNMVRRIHINLYIGLSLRMLLQLRSLVTLCAVLRFAA
jgi:hypothetical protein